MNHTGQGNVAITPKGQEQLAEEARREEEKKKEEEEKKDDEDDEDDEDPDDEDPDDEETEDDGDEPAEGEYVDPDAATDSDGAGFSGGTRGDFVGVAGSTGVDIRITNTGNPDTPQNGPDTSAPPAVPVVAGDEEPQDEATDVLGFAEIDIDRLSDVVTTVRPELIDHVPELDPSMIPTVDPYALDGAGADGAMNGAVGFVMAQAIDVELGVSAYEAEDFAGPALSGDLTASFDSPDGQVGGEGMFDEGSPMP